MRAAAAPRRHPSQQRAASSRQHCAAAPSVSSCRGETTASDLSAREPINELTAVGVDSYSRQVPSGQPAMDGRPAGAAAKPKRAICTSCDRPAAVCLCDTLPGGGSSLLDTAGAVCVVQHPAEAKRRLATLPLLQRVLCRFTLLLGRRVRRRRPWAPRATESGMAAAAMPCMRRSASSRMRRCPPRAKVRPPS